MTKDELITRLPEKPEAELISWARQHLNDELGGELTFFSRESSVTLEFDGDVFPFIDAPAKPRWGARCTCSACNEDYAAGWAADGPAKGIILRYGDDGSTYPGIADVKERDSFIVGDGDTFSCPLCDCETKLIHKSKMPRATYSILVLEVRNIKNVTCCLYWRICKSFSPDYTSMWAEPFAAVALLERAGKRKGLKLQKYSHYGHGYMGMNNQGSNWTATATRKDPEAMLYYDYGSSCKRKCGAVLYSKLPDLTGCTGEKTGLYDYLRKSNVTYNPLAVSYLELWRKHPNAENLVKAGFSRQIQEALEDADSYYYSSTGGFEWVAWSERKPHKMLRIQKNDIAWARQWSADQILKWQRYNAKVEPLSAADYDRYKNTATMRQLERLMDAGWQLSKIMPYLQKQKELTVSEGVGLFLDYRRMLKDNHPGEHTQEELFPPRLRAAHDRLAAEIKSNEDLKYQAGFNEIIEKYSALEWTDGELCIRLPRASSELVREGQVLRHCVGGYSQSHIAGKCIFFVRHYRRPERCYYTLNEDLSAEKARRIQLHGYGNERHGPNKEHRHEIPKTVKDFVNRWEREVLAPFMLAEAKKKKSSKKGAKVA